MNAPLPSPVIPLSILIVDDEPPARRRLARLLAVHPNALVVAEAASVRQALARLSEHAIDLAFVDIQLPGENAFELFRSAPVPAAVVFVTAHAEHALRAFECDVVDYLLKPIRPERLANALARAERWRAARRASKLPDLGRGALALRHRQALRLVAYHDILHIVARDDHSELYLRNGSSYLDATRMDAWEQRLPTIFLRTHRSHIVNLRAAQSLCRRPSGWVLELAGALVPVSRSRVEAVRTALAAVES